MTAENKEEEAPHHEETATVRPRRVLWWFRDLSLAAAEIRLRSYLRKRPPHDRETKNVHFVEGQPSDIIEVVVGDYSLERKTVYKKYHSESTSYIGI